MPMPTMCAAYLWAEQIDPEVAVGVGCEGGEVAVEMMMMVMMMTIIVLVITSVIMVASLPNPHPGRNHNSSNDSSLR